MKSIRFAHNSQGEFRRLFMGESVTNWLVNFLAPGIEETKENELKVNVNKDQSIQIDVDSLRKSEVVKEQIDCLQNEERA